MQKGQFSCELSGTGEGVSITKCCPAHLMQEVSVGKVEHGQECE